MLSAADNDLMCRVNPGTAMGAMLSEYWWPVLRSDKLEPDGAPERVRLLGRDFVAFRVSDGRLGFLNESCPHRGASLALGRNEDCALRCLLHGWKIDVDGKILELPNEARAAGDKKKAPHWPIREAGGMIWVWIGEGQPPPFPELSFNRCEPGIQIVPVRAEFNCNWVQLMETVWDPAHVGILHGTGEGLDKAWAGADTSIVSVANSALGLADCRTSDEPYGFRFRFDSHPIMPTHTTVMPSWVFIGALGHGENSDRIAFGHVPVDDHHTLLWQISYNPVQPLGEIGHQQVAGVTDFHNWRPVELGRANNWGQDREAMRNDSFTGIGEGRGVTGLLLQDVAMSESMGPIVDRSDEHLGPADLAVIKGRQVLLSAVRAHMNGAAALGVNEDVSNIGCPGGHETEPVGEQAKPQPA